MVIMSKPNAEFSDDEMDMTEENNNPITIESLGTVEKRRKWVKDLSDQKLYIALSATGKKVGPMVKTTRDFYEAMMFNILNDDEAFAFQLLADRLSENDQDWLIWNESQQSDNTDYKELIRRISKQDERLISLGHDFQREDLPLELELSDNDDEGKEQPSDVPVSSDLIHGFRSKSEYDTNYPDLFHVGESVAARRRTFEVGALGRTDEDVDEPRRFVFREATPQQNTHRPVKQEQMGIWTILIGCGVGLVAALIFYSYL